MNSSVRGFLEAAREISGRPLELPQNFEKDQAIGEADDSLARSSDDLAARQMSRREEARIGVAIQAASSVIQEMLIRGDRPRADGFFDRDHLSRRSAADEIAEGVLTSAQREHEERKLPYLGYLIANVGFSEIVDKNSANWALSLADDLTWGEYLLLAMVGRREEFVLPAMKIGRHAPGVVNAITVHEQLSALSWTRQLIGGEVHDEQTANLDPPIREYVLASSGRVIYTLLSLERVPAVEIQEVIDLLSSTGRDE